MVMIENYLWNNHSGPLEMCCVGEWELLTGILCSTSEKELFKGCLSRIPVLMYRKSWICFALVLFYSGVPFQDFLVFWWSRRGASIAEAPRADTWIQTILSNGFRHKRFRIQKIENCNDNFIIVDDCNRYILTETSWGRIGDYEENWGFRDWEN